MRSPGGAGDGQGRIRTTVERSLKPLTVPNFVTLFRMAIVPFFVKFIELGISLLKILPANVAYHYQLLQK